MSAIIETLIQLGLSGKNTLEDYHPRVRDHNDISALRCSRSGAIVLSRSDHITSDYYSNHVGLSYWGGEDRASLLKKTHEDDRRRAGLLRPILPGKRWLDIGTGLGGVLEIAGSLAKDVVAIEPQEACRSHLMQSGHRVLAKIEEADDASFDVISIFHVFEHLTDPIEFLSVVKRKLVDGGLLLVEVPHGGDALLTLYQSEAFRNFTLWSEHLILHTRITLGAFLSAGGFDVLTIEGVQRYPLANHLHWLAMNQPNGHMAWSFMNDQGLDAAYAAALAKQDRTDTLLAYARAPAHRG